MSERRLRLTEQRVREIRTIAWNCLRQVDCKAPAVPVEAVARKLGITTISADIPDDDVSGMLVYKDRRPMILVNANHHANRRRFTIAHECGHFLLGHLHEGHVDRHFVINRDANSSEGTSLEEVEANQFAAELLMPVRFLLKDFRAMKLDLESDDGIKLLARKYEVSSSAMGYRIANVFM